MITRITLGNYKSLLDTELRLAGLTVLIGANASGKSNALEAIQLLAWLAGNRRLHDIGYELREQKIGLRGLPSDLPSRYVEGTQVTLGCEVRKNGHRLQFQTRLGLQQDGLHVVEESLVDPDDASSVPLYRVAAPAGEGGLELAVDYNNFKRGKNKPRIACIDQQAIFTQLATPSRFANDHEEARKRIPDACRWLQSELTGIHFLEPAPSRMRGYSHVSSGVRLDPDGLNVSAVLNKLCDRAETREEILSFVRSLPEQSIASIDFVVTGRDEVMVKLTETFGGGSMVRPPQSWDATLLSDGTLRVLAIAAALLSVPEGTLLIIEEIDNGVHPSRAEELMGHIRAIAERRSLRVLLTTHNPALLDHLPNQSLPDVIACYRDPNSGVSRLQRLEDLETYPELIAQGSLGHLVTERILEKALQASQDRRPRTQQNLNWVREQGWDTP